MDAANTDKDWQAYGPRIYLCLWRTRVRRKHGRSQLVQGYRALQPAAQKYFLPR